MDYIDKIKDITFFQKIVSVVVITLLLVSLGYIINIALLTFVMAFVFYKLLGLVQKLEKKHLPFKIPDGVIIIFFYSIFTLLLVLLSIKIAPAVATIVTDLGQVIMNFDILAFRDMVDPRIYNFLSNIDFNSYIVSFGSTVLSFGGKLGSVGVNFFFAYILSLVLLLEKKEISRFGEMLGQSKISFIYNYFMYFGKSFVNSFTKVMQVQVIIATLNAILSSIILGIMGFPQVWALGLMILALGLIPVAGVIISLIPLTIIAFKIGGIFNVLIIWIMIAVLHALEAYVLNPKLMSNKTKLPVFFVFIILLIGEHYLGVWGLLIGIPTFIFLLDVLDVKYEKR